ncbi:MAG: hypothetical protein KGS45_10805 [Planctomycetes bacterium]|nr:hypothetical protein [Planctomycetota bacterium]
MKVKGISGFEQHVEKLAVGGAAVLLVGVGAWQFLVPSTVKVGNKEVPPNQVLIPIADAARRVKDNVDNPSPKLPDAPTVALSEAFKKKLAAGVAPRTRIPELGSVLSLEGKGDANVADAIFALPLVPSPGVPVAHAFWCTVDPIEVVQDEKKEVAAILPTQQPFDKAAVSVEATFNGAALRQILDSDPDGSGPLQSIRRGWWQDRTYIIGVEMEREELSSSGSWGDSKVMSSIPGRSNPIQFFSDKIKNPGDAISALTEVAQLGEQAYRTPFYETITGTPQWVEPALAAGDQEDPGAADSAKILRDRAEIERSIERIEKQLQELGGGGPGSDRGGGGRGRNAGPAAPTPNTPSDPKQAQRKQLETRLANEQSKLDNNTAALEKLGLGTDGKPLPGGVVVRKTEPQLMDNQALKIWAHDVSAVPGKTYRYRLRVVINNPFFGQAASLKDDQKIFAKEVLLRGDWSAWGMEVAVEPQTQFFITSAAQQDALRGPRATVEMFTFYYGYPRKAVVNVEPGDGLNGEVKLPEGLMSFDLDKFERPKPNPNAMPVGDPGDGGGAGKGGGGGGKGGGGNRAPDERKDPDPALPGQDPIVQQSPGLPLPRDLKVKVDAVLMDVATAALGGNDAYRTLFREGPTGRLFVRTPEESRSEAYRKLAKLAEIGRNQGKAPPAPVKKERPETPTPPPPPPRNNPGGGGGGGGSGGG